MASSPYIAGRIQLVTLIWQLSGAGVIGSCSLANEVVHISNGKEICKDIFPSYEIIVRLV